MDRKDFVGGSDIAAIMGLSRWKSSLQLWAEKTGEVEPDDISEVEAVQLGTELEDFVAKKFQKETGLKVRRTPTHYTHPYHPYMKCQVDRIIEGTDELLECKTASAWKYKEWEDDEIPAEYIYQVMWQLGITGRRIGHIAVLIGGQKFRTRQIEFDQEMFDAMVGAAENFWEMVKAKNPPMAVGIDNPFVIELHPQHDDQIQQVDELNDTVGLLMQTKNSINDLMKTKDDLEAKIKQVIGGSLGIKTEEYTVTWKGMHRRSVDTKRLKDDGLYNKYATMTETRVLRVKKGENNGESK